MALLSFFNLANEKLEIADKWLRNKVANLATVATTGNYNDLSDRPNIGTTDISGIGDGTITGAIDTINSNLSGKLSGGILGTILANTTKTISFSPSSAGFIIFGGGTNNLASIYQYTVTTTTLIGRTIDTQGSDLSYVPTGLTLPVTNNNTSNTTIVSVISLFGEKPTLS